MWCCSARRRGDPADGRPPRPRPRTLPPAPAPAPAFPPAPAPAPVCPPAGGGNPCRYGAKCFSYDCSYDHPAGRKPKCRFGAGCNKTGDQHHRRQYLHPRMRSPAPAPAPPAEAIPPAATWKYDDGPNGFREYGAAEQVLLEKAYQSGQRLVNMGGRRGNRYTVDIKAMSQRNNKTRMDRAVRRAPAAGGLAPTISDDGTDPTPQSLCTTLHYNHQAGFTTADFQRATGWTVLRKGQYDPTEDDVITCMPFGDGPVVELSCSGSLRGTRCIFRQDSVEPTLRSSNGKCPLCKEAFPGLLRGTQGTGTMTTELHPTDCDGHPSGPEGRGSFKVRYNFPAGTQSQRMDKPGQPYKGANRTAYFPNNKIGRKALRMVQQAFQQGQLFGVGVSVTMGGEPRVTWGIHQKSKTSGGTASHGFPDPTFFQRLFSELAAVGILDSGNTGGAAPEPAPGPEPAPAGPALLRTGSHATATGKAYEDLLSNPGLTDGTEGADSLDQRQALIDLRAKEAEDEVLNLIES